MPREKRSQIVGVSKPRHPECEPVVVPLPERRPSNPPCPPPHPPICVKETELEIIKNDIAKLKQAAEDSADGVSIEKNHDSEKLQIKDFDTAHDGEIVVKRDGTEGNPDVVVWAKPQLVAVHLQDDKPDEFCMEFQLN